MKSLPAEDESREHPAIAPDVAFNPLWIIATAMAGFFMVAGLVVAFG